jgi:hypothetical protein
MSRMIPGARQGTFIARFLRWCVAAAAIAVALAGCGGGGGTAGASSPGAASAQTNPVAAFALAQQSVSASDAPAAAAAAPDNMVANGDFENGSSGWAYWGNSTLGASSSGSTAMHVGTGAGGVGQVVAGIVPGTTYRLTAQAQVSAASETAYIGLNFADASGAALTQNSVPVSSTSWTTATVEAVAPPGAVKALVYVWKNAGSGGAEVDNYSLQAIGVTQAGPEFLDNKVVNGGIESGLQGWQNWGNTLASSADVPTGAQAAQVGPGAGGFGQLVGGIVGGASYRVSALAKVSNPSEPGYLGVAFIDGAGHWLLVQNVVFASTTFARTEANATAPASATQALVFVWKNAGTGLASLDDVALFQVDQQAPTVPPAPLPIIQMGQRTQILNGHAGANRSPSIARLSSGEYVTAWVFKDAAASADAGYQVCFVRQEPGGLRLGSSSCVSGAQASPSYPTYVLARPDGGFVIVWNAAADAAVQSQAFDAAGNPVGGIQAGAQRPVPAKAAALAGGGYVDVTVQPGGLNTSASMVSFQRYASDGTPIGPATSVGDSGGIMALPAVPLTGGGFAVAWLQDLTVGAPTAMARMFADDGTPTGGPVVVSGTPPTCGVSTGCQYQGLAAMSPIDDGGYVVMWWDGFGRGTPLGTFARRFLPDGTPTPVVGKIDKINLIGMAVANDAGQFLLVHPEDHDAQAGSDIWARLLGTDQLR